MGYGALSCIQLRAWEADGLEEMQWHSGAAWQKGMKDKTTQAIRESYDCGAEPSPWISFYFRLRP